MTLFLSNVTKKWADQAAYSLAGVLCLLKMMIMIARPRPLSGILYPCPRRSDAYQQGEYTWVQSQHLRALNPWQMDDTLWKEGVYHRESDVNSG